MNLLSLRKTPQDGAGLQQAVAAIKQWTRAALGLGPDVVVSVNELACSVAGCPPRQTIVLVLGPDMPSRKLSIHTSLLEVNERDIVAGWASIDGA